MLQAIQRDLGVRTLMVEGGARVIRSFLHAYDADAWQRRRWRMHVVVTVAPRFLLSPSLHYLHVDTHDACDGQGDARLTQRSFQTTIYRQLGEDLIVLLHDA